MNRPAHRILAVSAVGLLLAPGLGAAAGDPYRSMQWGLERIGAPSAWTKNRGEQVRVAVVDTGIDLDHPDLAGRLLAGRDFVDGDADPRDEHGHGTLVAGIIAASAGNGIGVAGVAPRVRILPVRALDREGRGDAETVAEAIRYASSAGVEVINLSLAVEQTDVIGLGVLSDERVEQAIRDAAAGGALVLVAAGNSAAGGESRTSYDATDPSVLVVGAATRTDQRAAYSHHGEGLDLVAPGGGSATEAGDDACEVEAAIVSTWWERSSDRSGYGASCGTSMATAFASGVGALLRAQGLSAADAAERMLATAEDLGPSGPDAETGRGLLDAAAALGVERHSPPAPPTSRPTIPVPIVDPPTGATTRSATPTKDSTARPSSTRSRRPRAAPKERPIAAPISTGVGLARLMAAMLAMGAGVTNIRTAIRRRR